MREVQDQRRLWLQELQELFTHADVDQSGTLTLDELHKVMEQEDVRRSRRALLAGRAGSEGAGRHHLRS